MIASHTCSGVILERFSLEAMWRRSISRRTEIAPKRDAHHILTLGYVRILLWLECSL
jgi:hypothetical protein